MGLTFYMINDVAVPRYAHPQRSTGLIYPQSEHTDLSGRPIGSQGYPSVILSWDRISVEGFRWWQDWTGLNLSVELSQLIVPDFQNGQTIFQGQTPYYYHSEYTKALLLKIKRDPSSSIAHYNNALWIEGHIEVAIREIQGLVTSKGDEGDLKLANEILARVRAVNVDLTTINTNVTNLEIQK